MTDPGVRTLTRLEQALEAITRRADDAPVRAALQTLLDGYDLRGLVLSWSGQRTCLGTPRGESSLLVSFAGGARAEVYADTPLHAEVAEAIEADLAAVLAALRVGHANAQRATLGDTADSELDQDARKTVHDLVNMLTIVMLNAEFLDTEDIPDRNFGRELEAIRAAAAAGADLLTTLRSLGDYSPPVPFPTRLEREIVQWVGWTEQVLAAENAIHVESTAETDEVVVDPRVFGQVFVLSLLQRAGPELDAPVSVNISSSLGGVAVRVEGAPSAAADADLHRVLDFLAGEGGLALDRDATSTLIRVTS